MGKGGSPSYSKPDPVPASSPPITPDNVDVQRTRTEQKQAAKKKTGWQSTLLAGLGDNPGAANGDNSLLG